MKPEVRDLPDGRRQVTYANCKPIVYRPVRSPLGHEASVEALHPAFREKFKSFLKRLAELLGPGYAIQVNCTFRSFEEQEKLYKQNPRTAAKPGSSPHNYGLAADFSVIDVRTRSAVTTSPRVIELASRACRELGLFYGAWFKNFTPEPWHVQVAETPAWRDLYNTYKEV